MIKRRILTVVMDGVGIRDSDFGNAVKLARTPFLDRLRTKSLYRTLKAHGTHVGLPSDSDIGNSEVGHNALGSGRVFDQGAKLVAKAIATGSIFEGQTWKALIATLKKTNGTLHLMGLLSDGNVHAHIDHALALAQRAKGEGIKTVRLHVLLDGRDVGEKTAETYVSQLVNFMNEIRDKDFDIQVGSGGGRMTVTMDRYNADWSMVERGWQAHVLGEAEYRFPSLEAAIEHFRQKTDLTDQNLPAFVIEDSQGPVGTIHDGDGVIFWNFRGDRAIEISRSFTAAELKEFDRKRCPQVFYTGMMEYDGDLHIPGHYLVDPPLIDNTLGELLVGQGVRQFACSETQKFGHVTYFWNGNKSGYIDESLEEYVEIPSDVISFDRRPWMKAQEITAATVQRLADNSFDVGRINYANGDMVGHTGNLEASIIAMSVVDYQIGQLMKACAQTDTILIVTADHGNCDEMFDTKEQGKDDWFDALPVEKWPKPKTAHTLNEVPFYFYDPRGLSGYQLNQTVEGSIANIAATTLVATGLPASDLFLPSLIVKS